MTQKNSPPKILILKHGALGDFIQSFPSFDAVRRTCPMAEISLLCDPSFEKLARISPYFDKILTDSRERPGLSLPKWQKLKKQINEIAEYDLVIDLQQSLRTKLYLFFAKQRDFAFLCQNLRKKKPLHALIRQQRILEEVHIPATPPQKLHWLIEAGKNLLPQTANRPYIVLAVETGKKQLHKSWPLQNFIQLAVLLEKEGFQPILTGLRPAAEASQKRLSKLNILDFRGKTNLADLAKIMGQASLCIGADTGSMHLASLCGCKTLVLFSSFSDPRFHSPIPLKAGNVATMQARDTASLSFREVLKTALHLLKKLG